MKYHTKPGMYVSIGYPTYYAYIVDSEGFLFSSPNNIATWTYVRFDRFQSPPKGLHPCFYIPVEEQ